MSTSYDNQRRLAEQAAAGEPSARKAINEVVDPIINYQTQRFCKRFCKEQRYHYKCTLPKPLHGAAADSILCEWGNASYGWMLDDLTSENRLRKYTGENGARIYDYAFAIANSLPFYERWKDWRFGRRVHVPTYIQALATEAKAVFFALRQGDSIELIAQSIALPITDTQTLASQIVVELTKRNRLHLLTVESTLSLDDDGADDQHASSLQAALASPSIDEEKDESLARLQTAWQTLDAAEQYILEAMLVDDIDANDILQAIQDLGIQINPKVAVEDTDRQQLYYFKRKTLVKLRQRMETE